MMAKCPVCETEYTPNEVETCSVCGYDLTPYPPIIGGIPSGFLEKEKKRIAAAKRVWQLSQSQVESAQLMVSKVQSQLDEMTRKIDGFTQSQSQLESQIEAIASQLQSQSQAIASQLKSQNEAIASQLQSQNEAIASQSQSRLESQIEAIASQSQSRLESQIEAIASQSQSRLESQIEAIASQLQSITEAVADTPIVSSSSGFDYTQLHRLLKSGQWKAADQETAKMMLAVAGKTQRGYLGENDIENFPCEDLRIIDGLWVKHSNGLFGFSVQKQIYINCGGKPDGSYPGDTIWYRFADEVGWRVGGSWLSSKDYTFSPGSAKRGHLPFTIRIDNWVYTDMYSSLAHRLVTCSI
ncbi:GUN4 domain-containing protein [Arthrospira platensis FACHB-439]|uniref:GUN4 domain-containing protein n=1 Tax=Limnospira platensis TaxID=118562 RepID=UPI0016873924|nr:GUN4 domain-containing protein [Arthrospira platensis FACHB-439]MBD2710620.1 GUN4 domain-containing protein [Arthrospira platensis FACHB-835]